VTPFAQSIDQKQPVRDARCYMARRTPEEIPTDLRTRLEIARLDLLALFRALDRMNLTPRQIPQRLIRQLFELDADYVEALWGLDQPPGKLNLHGMLRDTLAALEQLPAACSRLRKNLPPQAHLALSQLELAIRTKLNPAEAYNMVPGRDPQNG
jgi:hypothetical protein